MTIDITAGVAPADQTLRRLNVLTLTWQGYQDKIAQLERELADTKAKVKELEEVTIPNTMTECGMANFTTHAGISVEVKRVVNGTIPTQGTIEQAKTAEDRARLAARREFGLRWLESNGHGGIIKTVVSLPFGKGQLDTAMQVVASLRGMGHDPSLERNVHPSTFVAWAKELLDQGKTLPVEQLGLYVGPRAKLIVPKR